MTETQVFVWITLGQYATDIVPDVADISEGSEFTITWSGQRYNVKKCRDDLVGTGTVVFFRKQTNTPFFYLGQLSQEPEIITPRNVEIQQTGIYRLTIRKDNMYMRIFNKSDTDVGPGCYKHAVLREMGFKNGEIMSGIGRYCRM